MIISSYSPPPPPRAAGEEDELRYDAVGQAGGGVWDGDVLGLAEATELQVN